METMELLGATGVHKAALRCETLSALVFTVEVWLKMRPELLQHLVALV